MNKKARVFVAGHQGLVGSAIVRRLEGEGFSNLLLRRKNELDLREQAAVRDFFQRERPEYVFLAAAKVGGILANDSFPAEFIRDNLAIQTNVIHEAWRAGVRRLLFLGSSCIYPKHAPQPMREEYLLTGELEPTNEPYAVAKIAGLKMCQAYNRQYGTRFYSVMPTNLYGPDDNFDPETSHVLPALIRKFHAAKEGSLPEVVVWGTGTPRREFLYVDDMADACWFVMDLPDDHFGDLLASGQPPFINLGTGEDVTIGKLAETVREVVDYRGSIRHDRSKPDGTPRKLLDVSRLKNLGWEAKTALREGIERTYSWFLARQPERI